jgi:hypothetical protein
MISTTIFEEAAGITVKYIDVVTETPYPIKALHTQAAIIP